MTDEGEAMARPQRASNLEELAAASTPQKRPETQREREQLRDVAVGRLQRARSTCEVTRVQLPPYLLLELVRNIAATDPKAREQAADQVTDLMASCSLADGRILTGVLAAAAACERDADALEAELNAIIQLGSLAEPEMVLALQALNIADLPGDLGDYVEDILDG